MYWEFQFGWCVTGVAIMIIGVLITRFHKQIADNLAGGFNNYEKVKLAGIIACAVGFIFMTCLHTTLIRLMLHIIAPNKF